MSIYNKTHLIFLLKFDIGFLYVCFLYGRHCKKPSKQAHLNKTRVEQEKESKSKAARVESWLLNGHISQTDAHMLANGIHGNLSERNYSSPSHHVHFARVGYNKWAGSDIDIPAHLVDSGCEDTRSNASSHTSGIVTDFPASPYIKQQTPSFSYYNSSQHTDTHSVSTHLSNVHSASDDGFHTLTRCACLSEQHTKLSHSSTLCPSSRTSRAGSTELSCLASDTIINEPMEMSPAVRLMGSTNEVDGRTSRGRLLRMKQKKPESPEQLSVKQDPEEMKWLVLEWRPVR